MTYRLNANEAKYFKQYQTFLNSLLTAVKEKKPFLWTGYDPKKDGSKYYYHPNYVRYYEGLYWFLYKIGKDDETVYMPLWTGEERYKQFGLQTKVVKDLELKSRNNPEENFKHPTEILLFYWHKSLIPVDAETGKFKINFGYELEYTVSVNIIIKDKYDITIKVEDSRIKEENKVVDELDIH